MKNISVIGAGTMGNGIAHVFAQYGFQVSLIDLDAGQLESALLTIEKNMGRQVAKGQTTDEKMREALSSIKTWTDMKEGLREADLVIEAATENSVVKLKIFSDLDAWTPPSCILASNTSSLSITKLGAATRRPDRVIGMHFMNPVPVMKLVEVINGYATSRETIETVLGIAREIGKYPCLVNDYPGFIANRVLMPMINEAVYCLHEGVAGVEAIDSVMKLGMSHPMGPLQLADFIGLDICHAILIVLYEGFGNSKYAPCPLLTNMVLAGHLGVKSGQGFYEYSPGFRELVVAKRFR
jgi:3-hydroxybutyryl-CoA dehydrogenase